MYSYLTEEQVLGYKKYLHWSIAVRFAFSSKASIVESMPVGLYKCFSVVRERERAELVNQ